MNTGRIYYHPSAPSIAMEVLRYFPVDEQDRAKVKVLWHRRMLSGQIAYCMNIIQRFDKPITYWKEWKEVRE